MRSISREAILFSPDPSRYLPHRSPFLYLDSITALEPGSAATALLDVTSSGPEFPPILLLEAMAQLGGIVAGQQEGAGGTLAAIERAELPFSVGAGDRVTVKVRIIKEFGRLFMIEGKASVGGRIIASGVLTLAVGKV